MKTISRYLDKVIFLLAFVSILFSACRNDEPIGQNNTKDAIHPPFENLQAEFTDYEVDATKGDTIKTDKGTMVIIPPNALVDTSGAPFSGKASIHFREYHGMMDAFLSGIPMAYNADGVERPMQTAGMFEIRADAVGRPLQIADGSSITVNLASYRDGSAFNTFRFDEDKNEWIFCDYSNTVVNPEKTKLRKKLDSAKAPLSINEGDRFILNYGSLLDVYFGFNDRKASRNFYSKALRKKFKPYHLKMYNMRCYQPISYQGRQYPAQLMVWELVSGKGLPAADEYTYVKFKRLKGNTYQVLSDLYNAKSKVLATVRCVMPIGDLIGKSAGKWVKEYEKYITWYNKEQERYRQMAGIYRALQISKLGIYNFDYLYQTKDKLPVRVSFSVQGKITNEKGCGYSNVFCFLDDSTFIEMDLSEQKVLYIDPAEQHFKIIAVLGNNRIATFEPEQYRSIDFEALKRKPRSDYLFVLEPKTVQVNTIKDIRSLLSI